MQGPGDSHVPASFYKRGSSALSLRVTVATRDGCSLSPVVGLDGPSGPRSALCFSPDSAQCLPFESWGGDPSTVSQASEKGDIGFGEMRRQRGNVCVSAGVGGGGCQVVREALTECDIEKQ